MTAAGLSARCAPLGKYRMPRACPVPPGFRNCSRRTRLPDRRLRISGRDAIRAGSGTSSAGGRPATGRSAVGPDCRPQGTDWSDTRIPDGVPARYRGRSDGGGMLPYCPYGCWRPSRRLCGCPRLARNRCWNRCCRRPSRNFCRSYRCLARIRPSCRRPRSLPCRTRIPDPFRMRRPDVFPLPPIRH